MLPFAVQTLALHVHEAVLPLVVHVWLGPHVVVVTHVVQPFEPVSHVCAPPAEHCMAPWVQAFVQHEAEPAAPVHAPLVHVSDEAS